MNSLQSEKAQLAASNNANNVTGAVGHDTAVGNSVPHDGPIAEGSHPLPPYSGPSQVSLPHGIDDAVGPSNNAQTKPRKYPGLPSIDYSLYSPPLFELSSDGTTLSTKAQYLSKTAGALIALIRSQASVPPKPQIRVLGKRGSRKVDFDLRINLMTLIIPEDVTQRMDYIRCVSDDEMAYRGGPKKSLLPGAGNGGLEEWCRRFVEDESQVKTFTLERVVANLDTEWLDGRLRSMIASTQYKGVVEISYPITHSRVVVQSPDKVNKFFTTVTSFFSGKKKYEVVQAVWPFATNPRGEEPRQCAVQGEEEWWKEWRDAIKYALSMKRVGWVSNEDRLEALMEGKGKGVAVIDWGADID